MNYYLIGGDLRNFELAKMLAKEGNMVYTFGLEKAFQDSYINENVMQCEKISDGVEEIDVVITALPFSRDEINVNMPLSIKKLKIEDFIKEFEGHLVFSGNISKIIERKFLSKNIKVVDIMKFEEFAILNTISTAEAAISIIIENTKITLQNSKCLIMGFGRIGKILAKKLQNLSANVECVATNNIEEAWGEAYGYNMTTFGEIKYGNKNLKNYDIIVNTIPKVILKKEFENINNGTLIIDLASKPYGINRDMIKEGRFNFIEALGLPGKTAPITAAKNIKKIVFDVLKDKS